MNDDILIRALITNKTIESSSAINISFLPQIAEYKFIPGQRVNVASETNSGELKSYSLSSSTSDNILSFLANRTDNICNLKIGDYIVISNAFGDFQIQKYSPVTLITDDIGLAQAWSIASSLLFIDSGSIVHFLYQSNNSREIIFRDKIEKMAVSKNGFSYSFFIHDREPIANSHLHSREIDLGVDLVMNERSNLFYISGKQNFVSYINYQLVEFDVPPNYIITSIL